MDKRWALLTSNEHRHRFLANLLSESPSLVAVVAEPKRRQPSERYTTSEEKQFLEVYFNARAQSEIEVLPEGASWNLKHQQKLITVEAGGINSAEIAEQLRELGVEHCMVFGTSWLKEAWLGPFDGRLINLHLGLSPYYRGAGTNFWALAEGKPEYVGATIHLIDKGIDSGHILFHVRPDPEPSDSVHRFFNKTIRKSANALREVLTNLSSLEAVPQWLVKGSREYKSKDFNALALIQLEKQMSSGLIRDYALRGAQRARAVSLVQEYLPVFGETTPIPANEPSRGVER